MGMTRPDMSSRVRELSRRISSTCMRNCSGLRHLLRYFACTIDVTTWWYNNRAATDESKMLTEYSDSDWGDGVESCRSVTGYIIMPYGSPLACKSKLQNSVTLLTSQAEGTSVIFGKTRGCFVQRIVKEIGILEGAIPRCRDTWNHPMGVRDSGIVLSL